MGNRQRVVGVNQGRPGGHGVKWHDWGVGCGGKARPARASRGTGGGNCPGGGGGSPQQPGGGGWRRVPRGEPAGWGAGGERRHKPAGWGGGWGSAVPGGGGGGGWWGRGVGANQVGKAMGGVGSCVGGNIVTESA